MLEELGHALFPGPLLPTVLVSGVIAAYGDEALRAELLPGLADGTITAAVAPSGDGVHGERADSWPAAHRHGAPAARTADGAARVGARGGRGGRDAVVPPRPRGPSATAGPVGPLPALDGTRALGCLDLGPGITVDPCHHFAPPDGDVRGLLLTLAAAESAGIARWCLETASDYAKLRVQFGRPIGQFQAVKHALADMLVAVEQGAAVAWDAAAAWSEAGPDEQGRDLSARIAGAIALRRPPTAPSSASRSSAASGSPGSTTRTSTSSGAMANLQLAAAGDVDALEHEVAVLAVAGARRNLAADLPPEAESLRDEIRGMVAGSPPPRRTTSAPPWPRRG